MRTFVLDRTCWSLLLTALEIRLRNKPMYDKLRVLIINKDVRKSFARNNGNENPIWSWNEPKRKIQQRALARKRGKKIEIGVAKNKNKFKQR